MSPLLRKVKYISSLSFSKNDTITMVFDLENEFYKVYTGHNSTRTLITDFPNFVDNKVNFPKFGINSVNLSNLIMVVCPYDKETFRV